MISVVIPACNEEAVIQRCLDAILGEAEPGEIELVVACNGCDDRTAEIARGVPGVVVVETAERSKARALNLGDARASAFPRLYVDADVRLSTDAVRSLAAALCAGACLAAPRAAIRSEQASWPVRAFHRAWMGTPYFRDGFVGCGVYGLSEAARSRFERFPDIISDDGFVRSLFQAGERRVVDELAVEVWAPRDFRSLLRVRTRSRLGSLQLRQSLPARYASDRAEKRRGATLWELLRQPRLWTSLPVYGLVKLLAEFRARRQLRSLASYTWARDESSRDLSQSRPVDPDRLPL